MATLGYAGGFFGALGKLTFEPTTKNSNITLSGDNLILTSSGLGNVYTQKAMNGYWYFELKITSMTAGIFGIGYCGGNTNLTSAITSVSSTTLYTSDGGTYAFGSRQTTVGTYGVGDVIGVQFATTGTVYFFKNNVLAQQLSITAPGSYIIAGAVNSAWNGTAELFIDPATFTYSSPFGGAKSPIPRFT